MKLKKIIASVLLTLGASVATITGLKISSQKIQEINAVAATDGSATKLIIKDSLKWNFRALCLHTFTFADGYSKADLDVFLKNYYVTKAASDSAIKESSTKSYTSGSSYIYINAGGTSTTREHYMPGWVLDYEIEVCNNGNTFKHGKLSNTWNHSGHSSNTTTTKNASALGKILTMECGSHWGQNSSYASLTNTNQSFSKVNVVKKYVSNGLEIQTSKTSEQYLHYKYDAGTAESINGYSNNGKWYTDSACTQEYSPKLLTEGITLYASYNTIQYKVNEYNVFDGKVEQSPFSTATVDPHYSATQEDKEGYVSKGIFLDKDGKERYEGILTSDTNLYHLYESENFYNLYLKGFDEDKWGKDAMFYIYAWNKDADKELYGVFPGKNIELGNYVADGVNFDGRGLYKISILNNSNVVPTHFIISSYVQGTLNTQTADLVIADGAYYQSNSILKGATTGLNGDLTLGAQAALAYDITEARLTSGSYDYEGKEYATSFCAIDSAKINDFLQRYNNLDDSKAFDETTFWTNDVNNKLVDDENVKDQADYTGLEVIATLNQLQNNTKGLGLNRLFVVNNSNTATVVVVIILGISISTICLYFFLKRRKQK